jgi:hypothetical protein
MCSFVHSGARHDVTNLTVRLLAQPKKSFICSGLHGFIGSPAKLYHFGSANAYSLSTKEVAPFGTTSLSDVTDISPDRSNPQERRQNEVPQIPAY